MLCGYPGLCCILERKRRSQRYVEICILFTENPHTPSTSYGNIKCPEYHETVRLNAQKKNRMESHVISLLLLVGTTEFMLNIVFLSCSNPPKHRDSVLTWALTKQHKYLAQHKGADFRLKPSKHINCVHFTLYYYTILYRLCSGVMIW